MRKIILILIILIGLISVFGIVRWQKMKIFQKKTVQTCEQLGGTICSADQSCVGPLVNASDSNQCCSTQCNPSKETINLMIDASKTKERIDNLTTGIGTMVINPQNNYHWQYYKNQIGLKNQIVRLQYNPLFGDPNPYNDHFERLDPIIEDIIANGGIPLIMFGGLPESIKEGKSAFRSKKPGWTGWPYRSTLPPKNFSDWENWVYRAVDYWANQKGYNFYLEIWNEPDQVVFWRGTHIQAFEVYKYGLQGARRANPNIKVGGMGFAGDWWWMENFLAYAQENQLELDFFSWHAYGVGPSDAAMQLTSKYGFTDAEVIIDEWAVDAGETFLERDDERNAAYMTGRIKRFLDSGVDRQTYFHLEELTPDYTNEFHGDFGLFTSSGIIKPSFNALLMLSKMSGKQIEIEPSNAAALGSVEGNKLFILLWDSDHRQTYDLSIKNLPFSGSVNYERYLIDAGHSNSYAVKDKIQKIDLKKKENVEAINNWPEVKLAKIEEKNVQINGNYQESINLEPYGTTLIVLEIK